MDVWLPAAIRFGIPYETFWELNPRILKKYQEDHNQKTEQQYKLADYSAWLNGMYIVNAVQSALSPKKVKYAKQPLSEKKETETETRLDPEQFIRYAMEHNKRFDRESRQSAQSAN